MNTSSAVLPSSSMSITVYGDGFTSSSSVQLLNQGSSNPYCSSTNFVSSSELVCSNVQNLVNGVLNAMVNTTGIPSNSGPIATINDAPIVNSSSAIFSINSSRIIVSGSGFDTSSLTMMSIQIIQSYNTFIYSASNFLSTSESSSTGLVIDFRNLNLVALGFELGNISAVVTQLSGSRISGQAVVIGSVVPFISAASALYAINSGASITINGLGFVSQTNNATEILLDLTQASSVQSPYCSSVQYVNSTQVICQNPQNLVSNEALYATMLIDAMWNSTVPVEVALISSPTSSSQHHHSSRVSSQHHSQGHSSRVSSQHHSQGHSSRVSSQHHSHGQSNLVSSGSVHHQHHSSHVSSQHHSQGHSNHISSAHAININSVATPSSVGFIIGIAVGASAGGLLLIFFTCIIVIIIFALIVRRKKKNTGGRREEEARSGLEMVSSHRANIIIDSSKFVIKYEDLLKQKKLAKGSFGIVYRGKYKQNIVAIKEFTFMIDEGDPFAQKQFIKELENEITMLSQLRHRNILNFMGACIQPPVYAIVTEFIEGGSLHSLLHSMDGSAKRRAMKWEHKLSLMFQISLACLYLHQQGVIHRDLKSHNVLLDGVIPSAMVPKVCDFGLAKSSSSGNEMTQAVGTPLWMAPEVMLGKDYGLSCDVFSYSIIMYEVLVEKIPYYDKSKSNSIHVSVSTNPDFRPTIPQEIVANDRDEPLIVHRSQIQYIELMKQCWQHDPNQRPKFEEIVDRLEKSSQQFSTQ